MDEGQWIGTAVLLGAGDRGRGGGEGEGGLYQGIAAGKLEVQEVELIFYSDFFFY